jgi:hypothetical protein
MITATFLAIFFIPLFYVTVVRLFGRKKGARTKEVPTGEMVPEEP